MNRNPGKWHAIILKELIGLKKLNELKRVRPWPVTVDARGAGGHIRAMNSQERLVQEIKSAMLAKDQEKLSALRMLKSAVGYTQIEKKTETLSEADFVAVVQKEVKKRRDSIEQFEKGGRPELAEREKKEIAILEQFLPKALSPEELEQMVKATIQELGAATKKEMGPVIKAVQAKAAGRADGKTISSLVGKLLP